MTESPVFTRTYDLLRWLLPVTVKFPRAHRFVLAAALQGSAFALQDQLFAAAFAEAPEEPLRRADAALAGLRLRLRLARDLELLTPAQHEHVARMVDEVGRLLGGWRKGLQKTRKE